MIRGLIHKYPKSIIAISGILAGGVFSFGLPALLLPIFLSVFFWVVLSQTKSTLRETLKHTALFYWGFYFIVLSWFLDTDVRLLAGLSGENARLLLGLCLVIMVTMLTIASLPFGLVLHKLKARLDQFDMVALIVLASAWVMTEWIRSWAFSIFLYAPGASMGDYWNFGSLGLGLISTPIGFFSRFVGMYGLSFLVVAASVMIIWGIKKRPIPILSLLLILAIPTLIFQFSNPRNIDHTTIQASVLQREAEFDDVSANSTDIKYFNTSEKDLIVLTEYSKIHTPGSEAYAEKYISSRLADDGVSLDVSADFTKPGERYNTLEARDKNGQLIDSQTKQLLIPTGEYLPGLVQIFYTLTGQDSINQNFAATRQLYRGQPPRVVNTAKLTVAPVACSGILGRNIYRQLVHDGGEVLTNSASLLIFSGSEAYFKQSLQMARFHAIANQRTYIQASMGAPAFVVDDSGTFIVEPEDTKTAFIDFSFTPKSNKTPYTLFGEWVLLLSGFVMLIFFGAYIASKIRGRRKH